MAHGLFNFKKALSVYGVADDDLQALGVAESELPKFARSSSDNRALKSWSYNEMPAVGARVGFMPRPSKPLAVSVFVTKGGVLKTSLTLNFARMAALHGLRTCVVGLDMQGDITTALGHDDDLDDELSLREALERMNSRRGLADVFSGRADLDEVILDSDIPTLKYIPETPELVALDQSLINKNRREYWLREAVIEPLKQEFDLIIMDCSPNWNRLITNALVASDILISPVECKINNFRNLQTFRALIEEFKSDLRVDFEHLYVPTRLTPNRKLSQEIRAWYQEHLGHCTSGAIRESTQGEEAVAVRQSIPEYAPTSAPAQDMRDLLNELWTRMSEFVSANDQVSENASTQSTQARTDRGYDVSRTW